MRGVIVKGTQCDNGSFVCSRKLNQSLRVSVKAHRSETCIRSHYDEYIIISSSTSSGCVFMSEDYMGRY